MKNLLLPFLSLLIAFSLQGFHSPYQSTPNHIPPINLDIVNSIVSRNIQDNHFSGSILIADQGKVVYEKQTGTFDSETTFSIASMTKLFTSIMILQLEEQGKLRLENTLHELLPSLNIPNENQISVHHLLLHISGLPNEKNQMYHQAMTPEAFVRACLKSKSKSKIGSFNYNNLDYVLLGLIIEALSNQSWEEVFHQQFTEELGMTDTGILKYHDYPANFAYSYQVSKKGKEKPDPLFYIENFYAAGSLYSTATDLLKLDQALYSNLLLTDASKEKLFTSYPEYNYTGYGVWNYKYPFLDTAPTIMERRGGILGANVVLVQVRNLNRTIIILSNNNRFNPDSFGDPENLREAILMEIAKE